eukprot:18407-Heterococcus_DN1.PRE.1
MLIGDAVCPKKTPATAALQVIATVQALGDTEAACASPGTVISRENRRCFAAALLRAESGSTIACTASAAAALLLLLLLLLLMPCSASARGSSVGSTRGVASFSVTSAS